jgi:hypothetical protein
LTETSWVSAVASLGWLVLALAAFRAHKVNARRTVVYALAWGAIFLAAAAIFGLWSSAAPAALFDLT